MNSHRDVIVISYQIKTSLHHVARTCCSVIVIYMQIIVEVNEEKRWIRSILTQIVDNTAAAIAERATSTANIANGCQIRERLPKPTRWRCRDRQGGTRSYPRCSMRRRRQRPRQHPRRHSPLIRIMSLTLAVVVVQSLEFDVAGRERALVVPFFGSWDVVIPPRGNYSRVSLFYLNHVLSSDPNFLVVVIFNIVKNSFLARLRNQGITLMP